MTKRVAFSLLAILLFTLSARNGAACSCAGRAPTPAAFKSSSDVFIGKVLQIVQPESRIVHHPDGWTSSVTSGPQIVRLIVEESMKGDQGGEVQFEMGNDTCAFPFEAGKQYLVYARLENGKLITHKCQRTRLLTKAVSDLKYIRGLANNEPQATLYGDVFREILDSKGELALQTPFEELTVIAESDAGTFEVTAESWGEFEMTLRPGKYRVRVERDGKTVSPSVEEVDLKNGDCEQKTLQVKFDRQDRKL